MIFQEENCYIVIRKCDSTDPEVRVDAEADTILCVSRYKVAGGLHGVHTCLTQAYEEKHALAFDI